MQEMDFSKVPLISTPAAQCGDTLLKFRRRIEDKYKVKLETFWDLHKWSTENIAEFWAEVWNISGIIHSKSYDQVIDANARMCDRPEWFRGARLNFAENILRFRDNNPAMIFTGEDRKEETVTYAQMYDNACLYAAALRRFGLKKGDCVVCYISNREEPIFAMLGCSSIGGIFTGASPLLGAQAVQNRFKLINPKILFTIDRFLYDAKEIELLSKVEEIVKGLPSLEKVVIVPSNEETKTKDISKIRNSCFIDEFLSLGKNEDGSVPDIEFEQLPMSHPVFITYTSGTTGAPKGVVHGSGILLARVREFNLHGNGFRHFKTLANSPVGWTSWNASVMNLFNGITVAQFEGSPFLVSPTYLWDLVDRMEINSIFLTPGVLDDLEKNGFVPTEKHHLKSLWMLYVGASVVRPQNYDFVYSKIKKDIAFLNFYGSTEMMGLTLAADQTLPVYKGEIPVATYGLDVQCYNEDGESVIGQPGEMVIKTPSPSMPLSLWGDKDGSLFKKTYFSTFPEVFTPGDRCIINPVTRGFIICGRSDETMNPKGCRFGSSEIYDVVNKIPEILDSVCVSQYSEDRDERVVLFLKMRPGSPFDSEFVERVKDAIERDLSFEHVPEVVLQVQGIPVNMNGKKMEILVKKIVNGMPHNPETVRNPECLADYRSVPEFSGY